MLLASCATVKQEPTPEPVVIEQIEKIEQEPAREPEIQQEPEPVQVLWEPGQTGPNGGLVITCGQTVLETADSIYETASFEDAVAQIDNLCKDSGVSYRLPTIDELKSIYEQLVVTELSDVELTYYWSSNESEDGTVSILNFDTGFEGKFYKDMDFVSLIPVTEIKD